jgi:dihydroxyacetone kinase-like predicted kinase
LRDEDNIDAFVDPVLKQYEKQIQDWKKDVSIAGKNIQTANIEQASHLARYDEIRVNIKSLLDYYEMRIKQVRSEALQKLYKSGYDHTSTEKEKIIDSDPKYLTYKKIHLEISEMHNMLSSISDQFKNRAYTLTNLVKIRMAGLEDITLYE